MTTNFLTKAGSAAAKYRKFALYGMGYVGLLIALTAFMGFVGGGSENSEFFAGSMEPRLIDCPTKQCPIDVTVRLVSLNEASNTVQVDFAADIRTPLADEIRAGKIPFQLRLVAGDPGAGARTIATLDINKDTPDGPFEGIETEHATGNLVIYRDVYSYPFDDYSAQLAIVSSDHRSDFNTRIVKLIAGRRLMRGDPDDNTVINFVLRRPGLQKCFVIGSCVVFMLVIGAITYSLLTSPVGQSTQGLMITVAGMILGAGGIRDLLGVTKLASFSAFEAFIIGGLMATLLAAFIRIVLVSVWPKRSVPATTGLP